MKYISLFCIVGTIDLRNVEFVDQAIIDCDIDVKSKKGA